MDNLASEIADLARQGMSIPEIAERLNLSEARIAEELDRAPGARSELPGHDKTSADSFPASDPPAGPAAP